MKLYLSIDLESWTYHNHHSFVKLDSLARKKKDGGDILESIDKVLNLLTRYNQKITFFVVAQLFEWYPDAIRNIRKAGHEIAYHTHTHTIIKNSSVMKSEILASRDFLKEFNPVGFRAPKIDLPKEAILPLVEVGFRYSSSVYGSYLDIFKSEDGLVEFPISTISDKARVLTYPRPITGISIKETPFGWASFLARKPLALIEKSIDQYNKVNNSVFMFVHNWQLFPPKNRTFPDLKSRITHWLWYRLPVLDKVEQLLKNYNIGRMDELVCSQKNIGIKK